VILVTQCINCLFYFRLFHINGYLQCVLFSYFLYIELQRVSYLVLIPAILMYVLKFGISMTNHVSAIISHLEHLDLQTMFQCHHYRNILVSCFFYALFNLLFTGIQAVLTEDVHLTVTMSCTIHFKLAPSINKHAPYLKLISATLTGNRRRQKTKKIPEIYITTHFQYSWYFILWVESTCLFTHFWLE
jgi:hypothetical protein